MDEEQKIHSHAKVNVCSFVAQAFEINGLTKNEYIELVSDNLKRLSDRNVGMLLAEKLFSLGSEQEYVDDNDIFDAIHAYLGSLEVPVSEEERVASVESIEKLIDAYKMEKQAVK